MSLSVLIAHSGERFVADPGAFSSLDALRAWIAENSGVPVSSQIHITASGKQVKLNTLLTEKKIFVFDRQVISGGITDVPDSKSQNAVFVPTSPPDSIKSQTELSSWQELFRLRKEWASEVAAKCTNMSTAIQDCMNEVGVIEQATGVALANLENHVKNLEQKHVDAEQWVTEVLQDQENTLRGWDEALRRLTFIPIKENLLHFISGIDPEMNKPNGRPPVPTLAAIVNTENVRNAGSAGPGISQAFQTKMGKITSSVDNVAEEARKLAEKIQRLSAESVSELTEEASKLIEDVEVIAAKVGNDYEHVLELPNSSKSVSQASKIALRHTKNTLPQILETATELGKLLQQVSDRKRNVATLAISDLQNVSAIESQLAEANEQLSRLEVDEGGIQAFELLGLVQRLPSLYGSLLAEAIRRKEWGDKVKSEASTLQEELAVVKEEEERRRKRWQKSTGAFILPNANDAMTTGIEINLQGEERVWPQIQRKDLEDFIAKIKSLGGMEPLVKEMGDIFRGLDKPTKAQARRVKSTFKNGSIHEANFGRSSLLLRHDDEAMKRAGDEKAKLEEKLRGSESRIRKLEDLLHRQSQMSRQQSNLFQPSTPFEPQSSPLSNAYMSATPGPRDNFSRSNSRQPGTPVSQDVHELTEKLLALEAELNTEREHTAELEKEVTVHLNDKQDYKERLEDADSAKKDLMANLESQQIEHAGERKHLEKALQEYKLRMEEMEDELYRISEKRDREKRDSEDVKRRFLDELDSHKRSSQATNDALLADLAEQKSITKRLKQHLEGHDLARAEHMKALTAAHMQLEPDEPAPQEFNAMTEAIEDLAERMMQRRKDAEAELAVFKKDVEFAEGRVAGLAEEINKLKDRLATEEMESFTLRETLAEERAMTTELRKELDDERSQLANLRAKLSEGETGSSSLKDRLTEGESKLFALQEQLAAEQARSQSFKAELDDVHRRDKEFHSERQSAFTRFEARSQKAKELTQRLFTYYERLLRLSEALGFVITWQDDAMQITRPSRSTSADDPSASINRSVSITKSDLGSLKTVDLVYWMQPNDADLEAKKYDEFIQAINLFDVDVFREAVAKRLKDIEHVARKWQKEARSYRDKYHRAQMDAHQKIAYRSFKEGDLALFLPTRNQATRPWAAFNVGAPHYFLREQDSHKLRSRDWLLARISKVEERVVDLSKSLSKLSNTANNGDRRSIGEASDAASSIEDENPFDLSDGLRWYMIDASEEKPGAPTTPGLAKSTVASARVDATGSVRIKKSVDQVSKSLSKSLASRRSSTNSRADGTGVASGARSPAVPVGSHGSNHRAQQSLSPSKGSHFEQAASSAGLGIQAENGSPSGHVESILQAQARASNPHQGPPNGGLSTSPNKAGKGAMQQMWDSLFSLDVSLESGKNPKRSQLQPQQSQPPP